MPVDDVTRRQQMNMTIKLVTVSWGAEDPERNLERLERAAALAADIGALRRRLDARGRPGPPRPRPLLDGRPPLPPRRTTARRSPTSSRSSRSARTSATTNCWRCRRPSSAGPSSCRANSSRDRRCWPGRSIRWPRPRTGSSGPTPSLSSARPMAVQGQTAVGRAESERALARAIETGNQTAIAGCQLCDVLLPAPRPGRGGAPRSRPDRGGRRRGRRQPAARPHRDLLRGVGAQQARPGRGGAGTDGRRPGRRSGPRRPAVHGRLGRRSERGAGPRRRRSRTRRSNEPRSRSRWPARSRASSARPWPDGRGDSPSPE